MNEQRERHYAEEIARLTAENEALRKERDVVVEALECLNGLIEKLGELVEGSRG